MPCENQNRPNSLSQIFLTAFLALATLANGWAATKIIDHGNRLVHLESTQLTKEERLSAKKDRDALLSLLASIDKRLAILEENYKKDNQR